MLKLLLVCLYACLSVCMFACLRVCMSACPLVCLSVGLFVCLPACLHVCLSVCLSVSLSVCKLVCLHVCVCLSFDLSACLRACQHACASVFLRACLSPWASRNLGLAPCALLCRGRVLTDSVGRTLGMNSSAVRRPFRVRLRRQFQPGTFYRSVEFRGELWGSTFWWREGLQSGALWRP